MVSSYSTYILLLSVICVLCSAVGLTMVISCLSLLDVGKVPFDYPESESELVTGYNIEFSGLCFTITFLIEYCEYVGIVLLLVWLSLGCIVSVSLVYGSTIYTSAMLLPRLVSPRVRIDYIIRLLLCI